MTRRPASGICVHCLRHSDERNWDHVFPRSWYPSTTKPNQEKWKIPSCVPCNREYGIIEDELLATLGLCLDPEADDTRDLVERSVRSMKPSVGRDEKDRRKRAARLTQVVERVVENWEVPDSATLPGFGRADYSGDDDLIAVRVSATKLKRFGEKLVRGITWCQDGRLIDPPYLIDVHFLSEGPETDDYEKLIQSGEVFSREPGIRIARFVNVEDPNFASFAINIWNKLKMFASIEMSEGALEVSRDDA